MGCVGGQGKDFISKCMNNLILQGDYVKKKNLIYTHYSKLQQR